MKEIFAEVITIGDEILYGQTLDTNTYWIGQQLNLIGVKIIQKTSIGDKRERILLALAEAEQRADIILITGGLGPTKDDITKKTMAAYFDSPISINELALKDVEAFFASRGRSMNNLNRMQAELPEKCQIIHNKVGTAPGMWFEKEGKVFVSMPGVPHEMKKMMTEQVLPRLSDVFPLPVIYHKMIKTAGIGESWLSEKIEPWEDNLPEHIRLAYLPDLGQVKLRLTAVGKDRAQLEQDVDAQIKTLLTLVEEYIYGYGDDTLEGTIGKLLVEKGKTVATAESCTGGFVAHTFTSVPGSSRYFQGGVTPYHNDLKIKVLGVKEETLQQHGAVSEQTVTEMASNVRELFNADYGLATSGIAGPDGGTDEKPVGTVWVALADGEQIITHKFNFTKDRTLNIQLTNVGLLNILRKTLVASPIAS